MKFKRAHPVLISILCALVSAVGFPSVDVAQQPRYMLLVAKARDVQVLQITDAGGDLIGTIPTIGDTVALVVAPNGQYAIALNEGNTVSLITDTDGPLASETELLTVGVAPRAVAISENSETAIVINAGDDPASYSVIRGLPDTPEVQTFSVCENQTCEPARGILNGTDIASIPGSSGISAFANVALSEPGNNNFLNPLDLRGITILDGVTFSEPARVRVAPASPLSIFLSGSSVAITPDGTTGFLHNNGLIFRISGLQSGGTPRFVGLHFTNARNGAIRVTPDRSMVLAVKTTFSSSSVLFYRMTVAGLSFFDEVDLGFEVATPLAISPDGRLAVVLSDSGRIYNKWDRHRTTCSERYCGTASRNYALRTRGWGFTAGNCLRAKSDFRSAGECARKRVKYHGRGVGFQSG